MGTLISWNPLDLSRPVMGLIYVLFYFETYIPLLVILEIDFMLYFGNFYIVFWKSLLCLGN